MLNSLNLYWNIHQEQRINEVEWRAITGEYAWKHAELSAEDVKLQYERMVLIISALWELLIEKWILSETDLANKISEIDARDGNIDGRKINKILLCPKCWSGISRKFKKCLVCWTEVANISELDAL